MNMISSNNRTGAVCCSPKDAITPKQISAWEQVLSEFDLANEELEKTITYLAEKVTPLVDQRPVGTEQCKAEPERERQYMSQVFESFHSRVKTLKQMTRRLADLTNLIEI